MKTDNGGQEKKGGGGEVKPTWSINLPYGKKYYQGGVWKWTRASTQERGKNWMTKKELEIKTWEDI